MYAHLLILVFAPSTQAQGPAELPLVVDQLVTAVTDGDYGAAAERARATLEATSSWSSPPAPQQLAALWQVLGAVGVYDGQDALISSSFAQACAIDTEHFEDRLGPRPRSQWEAACRHSEPSASLTVGPLRTDSVLWVDGRAQQASPVALVPGEHLIHVLTPEHEPFVASVKLEAQQQAIIDTGLLLPPVPPSGGGRHALLATGTGASLLAGAALGVLAWQAHGTYSGAYDTCSERECSPESGMFIQQSWQQRNSYAAAAGIGGGLAIGLGTALVITW